MELEKIPINKTRATIWAVLGIFYVSYMVVSLGFASGSTVLIRDIFYEAMGFATVSILIYTAFKVGNKDRRLWTFIAAGGFFWMAGDIGYRFAEAMGYAGPERLLSFADILYLPAYAAFVCSIQTMARLTRRHSEKGFDWVLWYPYLMVIGAFIISGLMALFLPQGVGLPYVSSSTISIPAIVNYLYPALDIGVLFGLMMIVLTHAVPFRRTWQEFSLFGLALFTLADINYSVAMPAGIYDPANLGSKLIIAMWLLGDIFIFMSAVYKLTEGSERLAIRSKITNDSLVISD